MKFTIKMYDNKGNLVYKSALDLDFYENEAYP